jgi:hypothetical protein
VHQQASLNIISQAPLPRPRLLFELCCLLLCFLQPTFAFSPFPLSLRYRRALSLSVSAAIRFERPLIESFDCTLSPFHLPPSRKLGPARIHCRLPWKRERDEIQETCSAESISTQDRPVRRRHCSRTTAVPVESDGALDLPRSYRGPFTHVMTSGEALAL